MAQDIIVYAIGLLTLIYVIVKVYRFVVRMKSKQERPICSGCAMNCSVKGKIPKNLGSQCSIYGKPGI